MQSGDNAVICVNVAEQHPISSSLNQIPSTCTSTSVSAPSAAPAAGAGGSKPAKGAASELRLTTQAQTQHQPRSSNCLPRTLGSPAPVPLPGPATGPGPSSASSLLGTSSAPTSASESATDGEGAIGSAFLRQILRLNSSKLALIGFDFHTHWYVCSASWTTYTYPYFFSTSCLSATHMHLCQNATL